MGCPHCGYDNKMIATIQALVKTQNGFTLHLTCGINGIEEEITCDYMETDIPEWILGPDKTTYRKGMDCELQGIGSDAHGYYFEAIYPLK